MNLADARGNIVASYTYDEFGVPLSSSESFPGGWSNPYRYDGRDLVRYDSETSLYWMSVRAYDPTLGRFISRDPLGRVPLMGWTSHPYAYAGNNPLVNVDPSGQRFFSEGMTAAQQTQAVRQTQHVARIQRIVPHVFGCKGTMTQCSRWANDRATWLQGKQRLYGIVQIFDGALVAGSALEELLRPEGGVKLKLDQKVEKFFELIGGLLTVLGGISTVASSFGIDVSFLDEVTDFAGAATSALVGLWHLVKNGLGWLCEGGLSAAWSVVVFMFTRFSLAGIISLVVTIVLHAVISNWKQFAQDSMATLLNYLQWQSAVASHQTVDQFCRANRGACQGY